MSSINSSNETNSPWRRDIRTGPLLARLKPANWFRPQSSILALAALYEQHLTRMRLGGPNYDQIVAQEVLNRNCHLDVTNAPDGSLYLAEVTTIWRMGR